MRPWGGPDHGFFGVPAGFFYEMARTADMNRTRIFSPFGLGVLDVAVGKWLYDLAVERGLQIEVPDFYGNLSR